MSENSNPMVFGNARFTVIADGLIRMEYSKDGIFINEKTLFANSRSLSETDFDVFVTKKHIRINTSMIEIKYTETGKTFSKENLTACLNCNGSKIKWFPGLKNLQNLGGTVRTLDQARGRLDIGEGLLSRDGWYLLDDSNEPIFKDDWITDRSAGHIHDWYLFCYGNDFKKAFQMFTKISGTVPLPRKYSLGSWYSRYWPYSSKDYREIIKEYEDHNYPLDIMVLDMDWHKDGWTGWSWNRKLLPDAEKLLQDIHKEKLAVTLNVHPADGVAPHEDMYFEFMAEFGKKIMKDSPKKPTLPFDASNKKYMEAIFKHTHTPREKEGVDFWWLDWQQFDKTVGMTSLRNLPWLNKLYYQQTGQNNLRGLSFSRWGGWGDHKHPIHFSGDTVAVWPMLEFQVPFTSTAGNVGCFFWSHDVGGHFGGLNPETNARWIQFGAMSASLRLHSTRDINMDKRPWLNPPLFEKAVKKAFHLRAVLFPYIYSSVWNACNNNLPFIKPMYIAHPNDEDAYMNPQQYMLGDSLLVAPIASPGIGKQLFSSQRVWFPEGVWYNWFTEEKILSAGNYDIFWHDINSFPLFAKGGMPIVLSNYSQRMAAEPVNKMIIKIFPGRKNDSNEITFFEDDGLSMEYRTGKYSKTGLKYSRNGSSAKIIIFPAEGAFSGQVPVRSYLIKLPCLKTIKDCSVNGKTAKVNYNKKENLYEIVISKTSIRNRIEIMYSFTEKSSDKILQKTVESIKRVSTHLFKKLKDESPKIDNFGIVNINEEAEIYKSLFTGLNFYDKDVRQIYLTKSTWSKITGSIQLNILDLTGLNIERRKYCRLNLRAGQSQPIEVDKIEKNKFGINSKRFLEIVSKINGKEIKQYHLMDEYNSYLLNWYLIGPFKYDPAKKITDHVCGPETDMEILKDKQYPDRDGNFISWFEYKHINDYNVVDLRKQINVDTAIAYAYTTINSTKEQDVIFEVNSDDGCEMWINGIKLHSVDLVRAITHEPEIVKAKLRKGENEILMKISQAEGSWEMKLKIYAKYPVTSKL